MQCFTRGLALPPQQVESVVFYATHSPVPQTDITLLSHYAVDLSAAAASLWVMLHVDDTELTDDAKLPRLRRSSGAAASALADARALAPAIGAGVCVWSFSMVAHRLPQLAAGLACSRGYAVERDKHLRRYYWMHASLLLWNDLYGATHPRMRWLWRLEPDVM